MNDIYGICIAVLQLTDDYAWVNWLALVVSGLSFWLFVVLGRRQNKLQADLVEIERERNKSQELELKRARLVARLESEQYTDQTGGRPAHRSNNDVHIRNKGLGTAKEVAVIIDGSPIRQDGRFTQVQNLPQVIGPGARVKLRYIIKIDSKPPSRIRLEWRDDSSDQVRVFESDL